MSIDIKPSTVTRVLLPHGGWHELVVGTFKVHDERVVLIETGRMTDDHGTYLWRNEGDAKFSFQYMEDGDELGIIYGPICSVIAVEVDETA